MLFSSPGRVSPVRERYARRVARVHTASTTSTASGSSGTLRPHQYGRMHTGSGSVPDSSESYASGRLSVGFVFTLQTTDPTQTVRVHFVGSVVCSVNANPTLSRPDAYGSLEFGTEPDPV